MTQKKISNIEELVEAKTRLQVDVNAQENLLRDKLQHFSSDYKGIVWDAINPFKENITINKVIGFLKGNGEDSGLAGKLFSKGVKYALFTFGVNLVKKAWRKRKE